MRDRSGIPTESKLLLYAGRISPEKNIGLLADVMKELSKDPQHDFRLLVAGAGPQSDWLRTEGEKHAPGKIKLLGHLDKETLADYYANADVFIHPNPKEPFGIAPLEAMASGVATVAPNAGGILSYATNENAWLVAPDPAPFVAAIREFVDDPELREQKITKAIATARDNTREASTDRLFATYDEIYEHFLGHKELFVDVEAAKDFDFVHEVISEN
jgi:glycosyltransferase involved in cell wall biosynthesis